MIGIVAALICGPAGDGFPLELNVEPDQITGQGEVLLVIKSRPTSADDLRLTVEVGASGPLVARGPYFVARWAVSAPRAPRRLAAGVVDLRTGYVAFALISVARRLRLHVKAEPGAAVELRGAEGALGTAMADSRGHAELTVRVPAGNGVEAVITQGSNGGRAQERVERFGPGDELRLWGVVASRPDLAAHLLLYRDSGEAVTEPCEIGARFEGAREKAIGEAATEPIDVRPVAGNGSGYLRFDLAARSAPAERPAWISATATCGRQTAHYRLLLPPIPSPPRAPTSGPALAPESPPPPPKEAPFRFTVDLEAGVLFPQVFAGIDSYFDIGAQLSFLLPTPQRRAALFVGAAYSPFAAAGAGTDPRLPGNGDYELSIIIHRVAFTFGLMMRFLPPGSPLNFYGEMGFQVAVHHSEMRGQASEELGVTNNTSAGVGAALAGGVEVQLGPGALAGEIGFGYTQLAQSLIGETSSGGFSLRVGYHLFFD